MPNTTGETPHLTGVIASQMAAIPVPTLLWCRQTMLAAYSSEISQIDRALAECGVKVPTTSTLLSSLSSGDDQPLANLPIAELPQQRRRRTQARRKNTNTSASAAATSGSSAGTKGTETKSSARINRYIIEAVNAMPSGGDLDQVETYIRAHHPDYAFGRNILSMNLKRQWNGQFLKAVGQVEGKGANPTYYPLTTTNRAAVVGKGFKNRQQQQQAGQEPQRATG